MAVRLSVWCILCIAICDAGKLYAQKDQPEWMHPYYATFIKHIDSSTQLPSGDFSEAELSGLYWQMAITQYYPRQAKQFLTKQVESIQQLSASAQGKLVEVVSSVGDSSLMNRIWQQRSFLKTTKSKLAVEVLHSGINGTSLAPALFSEKGDSLWQKAASLCASYGKATVDIQQLLDPQFLPGEFVYISLQHRNRDSAGELRVRTPKGEWLRTNTKEVIRFPQLARSITNLPFCITNGHTPQGLYKAGAVASSDNAWIGATPNLQLALPFEKTDSPFFDSVVPDSYVQYASVLASLAKYPNLWEAYYAAALGRSEIIAHGTAIPIRWYNGKTYQGFTPSMGCLCMPETWYNSAKAAQSTQQAFMELHNSLPSKPRYLLVVNVW